MLRHKSDAPRKGQASWGKNPTIHHYQLGTAAVLAWLGAPGSSPGVQHAQDSGPAGRSSSTVQAAGPEPPCPVPHTDRVSPKTVNTSLDKTTPTAGGAAAPTLERTSDAEEDGNCVVQGEVQGAQGSGLV